MTFFKTIKEALPEVQSKPIDIPMDGGFHFIIKRTDHLIDDPLAYSVDLTGGTVPANRNLGLFAGQGLADKYYTAAKSGKESLVDYIKTQDGNTAKTMGYALSEPNPDFEAFEAELRSGPNASGEKPAGEAGPAPVSMK